MGKILRIDLRELKKMRLGRDVFRGDEGMDGVLVMKSKCAVKV